MNHLLSVLVLAATAASPAQCQTFANLDFESAVVTSSVPPFGLLDWSSAAPGWSHGPGSDSGIVYHGITHTGVTQWFLLVDSALQPGGPLAGNYSMRFANGHESGDPSSPWVNVYLSQVGLIPTEVRSLTLLASGPLAVSVGGSVVPLISLGGSSYAVDVTPYSGSAVEIRFINTSQQLFDAVVIDAIALSASPVPEPAAWILFCMGAAGASACRQARLARPSDAKQGHA